MELQEFIEKNCPDYDERREIGEWNAETNMFRFYEYYFPFAIQNFADKICAAQRENCKASYWDVANVGCNIETVFPRILNAGQPKIEEL